ncbi:MAG: hypothetical protein WCF54_02935, partial [Terracidiphilus sp.]
WWGWIIIGCWWKIAVHRSKPIWPSDGGDASHPFAETRMDGASGNPSWMVADEDVRGTAGLETGAIVRGQTQFLRSMHSAKNDKEILPFLSDSENNASPMR